MKQLLIIILAMTSIVVSAAKLTEADIVQLTKESQEYILGQNICGDIGVAEGRVNLKEDYIIYDDDIPLASAFGSMHYRCKGSVKWQVGEYCEFRKEFNLYDWEIDYCDI